MKPPGAGDLPSSPPNPRPQPPGLEMAGAEPGLRDTCPQSPATQPGPVLPGECDPGGPARLRMAGPSEPLAIASPAARAVPTQVRPGRGQEEVPVSQRRAISQRKFDQSEGSQSGCSQSEVQSVRGVGSPLLRLAPFL